MRNKTEMGRCFLVLKPYFSVPLAILKEIKGESKMSKKVVRILTMLGVIFFLFMGKEYDYGAESQHGVPYSTGYVVDGKYNSIHSGVLGGNQKRENDFSRGATIFYGLGGVCGVIFAGTFLGRRKR